MMSGAQYGHVIKHLETSHLDALPVPVVQDEIAQDFKKHVQTILALRNQAHRASLSAEERFSSVFGPIKRRGSETGFEVQASDLFGKRRRLEASFHAPAAATVLRKFIAAKAALTPLSQLAEKVWWMTRFRRFYGEEGIPYLSANELFTTNPGELKRILVERDDGHENFYVKAGWIVMACSGQVYGLNGSACLVTGHHENTFFSHDLIRIIPKTSKIRAGYLLTALTHPVLGRPLLIRAAYGTSIPHLDPGDVSDFPVVRLAKRDEEAIADFAEEAALKWGQAEEMERKLELHAASV